MILPVPSSSFTLTQPITNIGNTTSTGNSVIDPIDQQPVISTLTSVSSGTTQLIPVIIGGAFAIPVPIATTAPSISLVATGLVASSSASALSSRINIGIIPIIKGWTDDPVGDQSDKVIAAIKGILPDAESLLTSLGGDKGSGPCSGSKKRRLGFVKKGLLPNPINIAKDIVHSVACITNSLTKITGALKDGADAVKGILGDIDDLTSLTNNLDQEEQSDDDQTDVSSIEIQSKHSCSRDLMLQKLESTFQ